MTYDPATLLDAKGTLGYMAPEMCPPVNGGRTKETDVYAFGMVAYEVIFGPRRGLISPGDLQTSGFGKETLEFIEQCLCGDPHRRPSAARALEHFLRVSEGSVLFDPGPSSWAQSTDNESRLDKCYHRFRIIPADHDPYSPKNLGDPARETHPPTTGSAQCLGCCW